jgi:sphingomyelin phosphodiesterase 2
MNLGSRGLKYLSQKRSERLSAFTSLLVTSSHHKYDVICLQELWVESDFLAMKSALRHKYPHSAYWPSSIVGSGLAIFSKWEILGRDFLAFGVCGEPGEIGGDWYAGKGVGSVTLKVGKLGEVDIFNAHVSDIE